MALARNSVTGGHDKFSAKILSSRIKTPDALTTDEVAAWSSLCSTFSYFSSPFYRLEYVTEVASVRPNVRVCVLYDNERAIGFFPFQFKTWLERSLGFAERIGGEMTDYCGAIAPPSLTLEPRELLELSNLNTFDFSHLDESQLEFGLMASAEDISPQTVLDGGMEAYWRSISSRNKRTAQDTLRCQRKITAEIGALKFHFQDPDPGQSLKTLIDWKRRQYEVTAVQDALEESWKRTLMSKIITRKSEEFSGVLSSLYAGDQCIALHLGMRSGPILHYWFPAYDPEFRRYSPGRLLYKELIEHAFRLGVRIIDNGAGESDAKAFFANQSRRVFRGAWHRGGLPAQIHSIYAGIHWRIQAVKHVGRRAARNARWRR